MPRKGLNISKCHKGKYEYWRGRYEKGIDKNGCMTYGEIYAKTYEEVEERLVKVQNEINANTFIEPTKITVAQWLDRWLKTQLNTINIHQLQRDNRKPYNTSNRRTSFANIKP